MESGRSVRFPWSQGHLEGPKKERNHRRNSRRRLWSPHELQTSHSSTKILRPETTSHPSRKKQNVRTHSHDDLGGISSEQLDELDQLLKQYDCDNFMAYIMDVQQYDSERFTIMYNHGLQGVFDECNNNTNSNKKRPPKMTMERLRKEFSSIVTQDWIC